MKKISYLASAAISTAFAAPALSSDGTHQVDEEMIVLATRTPIEVSRSLSAVTVIDRSEIERLQASDLFELLSRVPGVSFIRNGGKGSSTSLILRGNQSDHSLFLIDGVRIGSATLGSASLSAISTSLIERVEIIRGPKSNLYGADAIGGVVNIISRKVKNARELSVKTSAGSNDTRETTIAGGVSDDSTSFTVIANSLYTSGIDNTETKAGAKGDDDAHRSKSLALNYQNQLTEKAKLSLSYNINDSENEYDGSCTNSTTFASLDCFIYSTGTVDSLSGLLEVKVNNVWFTSLQIGSSDDKSKQYADNIDINTTFSAGEFNTSKQEATWLNNIYFNKNHILTAGVDYQKDEVSGSTDYDESSRDNKAGFIQYQSNFSSLSINLGTRYDDNEQFGSQTTASALIGYDLNEHYRLVASYGEGFKAPTFNDLYFPGFGNDRFKPEESKNYELGISGDFNDSSFTVTAFQNEVTNLIQYNSAIGGSDQVAEAEITGLEFSVDTEFAGIMLGLSGSVIDPENKVNGKNLRRRAEQSFSLDADYDWSDFSVGLTVRTESERYDDVSNDVKLGGYTVIGLRAAYELGSQWVFRAKIDNVTDKQYATARDRSAGRYLSIGREVHVSVEYIPEL